MLSKQHQDPRDAGLYPSPNGPPPELPPRDLSIGNNGYVYDAGTPPVLPPIGGFDNSSYINDAPQNQSHARQPSGSSGKLRKPVAGPSSQAPIRLSQTMPLLDAENEANKSKPQRLSKTQRRRSSSASHSGPNYSYTNLAVEDATPAESRFRSSSAQPPSQRLPQTGNETRIISGPPAISVPRPTSSHDNSGTALKDHEKRGRLRRSWLPGSSSRSQSKDAKHGKGSKAWVLGQNVDYNADLLAIGDHVPELWNEQGDVCVYLHPRGSGFGPSFKVPTFAISTSLVFNNLIAAEAGASVPLERNRTQSFSGQNSLTAADAERSVYPPLQHSLESNEQSLYLLMSPSHAGGPGEFERLVSVRNLFAFLTGQPLVATAAKPTLFKVLLEISDLLKEYQFTSLDGTSFGDAVNMSFGYLMDQHALADVRHSREKTLEALVLGERMRSMDLYKEAFAHAAGKYTAVRELKSSLWDLLTPDTRERLERAHLDLVSRQNNVNNRLESFEFPALFSGIANSTTHTEYRDVKYAVWRKSFHRMRQLVLGHYKTKFGNWPPKARSKKNNFSESGLNRQVLKILYSDCCALYDLLVDRQNITTRAIDQSAEEDEADQMANPHISALRRMLTEFDQSSPPVLPPMPFDVPMLPDMSTIKANYATLPPKEQQRLDKNLQEYERVLILNKSYDFETSKLRVPLLVEFLELEDKETKGKTVAEMAEQRIGYWLFLYVVIQSLPMLVVDAPGLQYTDGVEYFLCQPPRGHPPWIEDAPMVRKRWYEVAGGGGLVELSTDAVEFGIEGIYHRSHCWLAAKQWESRGPDALAPPAEEPLSPLPPPQAVFTDMDPGAGGSGRTGSPLGPPPGAATRGRSGSPHDRKHAYRKSIALGLEPVMLPPGTGDSPQGSWGPNSASSMASPPTSGHWSPAAGGAGGLAIRNRSSGNLPALHHGGTPPVFNPSSDAGSGSRQASVGGSTFDDILKDIEQPKKKKSFF
ncbi:hypothetical protein Micbo1qcDRAFT_162016 [Microdochium bolleyi]|uniref:DUF8004 domain-containing protein n=1 Tax=Microdochium bolleyi TaxID=196109 RepID=A0A136J4B8_9PEZI|nr:hypothetical protein Micbo1qcDRAFT_162016 [Microdochium bolleyi]